MEGIHHIQLIRRAAIRGLTIVALLASGSVALALPAAAHQPATAASSASRSTDGGDCARSRPPRQQRWLDGFRLGWVPSDIGSLVTDFESEWEEVRFRSRVWESGPDADGAYRVDLQVAIMRSPAFTDPAAVREFLVEYLEREPDGWATEKFDHPDGPGFRDADEFVWLAEPGTAVRIAGYGEPVSGRELQRAACAIRQVMQR